MTVIEDPVLYLKDTRPGQSIKRIRSVCIEDSKVPAYIIQELNGCGVNGTACLLAFASGKEGSFDSSLKRCLAVACRGFTRTVNGTVDYYTRLGKEAPFVRTCLNAASAVFSARSSLFAKRRAVREILAGRPVLLNIGISGQYRDHTVTAYGLEEYAVGPSGKKFLFFKIRDGYSKDERYLLYRGILGISVTYLKPKT